MLAAFGDEIAQAGEHLIAHMIGAILPATAILTGLGKLFETRVKVFHAAIGMAFFKPRVKGDMVDTGAIIVDVLRRFAQIVRQINRRALHRMAQTDIVQLGHKPRQCGAIYRHRIDILQKQRSGTALGDIGSDGLQHWHGAQPTHNTANA